MSRVKLPNWAKEKNGGILGGVAALVVILGFLGFPTIGAIFKGADELLTKEPVRAEDDVRKERPAPRVTFASGEVCLVKFSLDFQLPEENVLSVFEQFGEQENAVNEVLSSVRGAVLSVLEGKSLAFVRSNRAQVEEEIGQLAAERIFSPGYQVNGVDLHEILC